jgi:predicted dienelactone hydrolase
MTIIRRTGGLLLVAVCLAAWSEIRSSQAQFTLPLPTGPYAVGTAVGVLIDSTRNLSDRIQHRPLTVQAWYPARSSSADRADYLLEGALLETLTARQYMNLQPKVLTAWRDVQTHAALDESIDTIAGRLPVLLLSHGFGVIRANYTALAQDLASHGYLVVSIDHPHLGVMVLEDGTIVSSSDPEAESPPAEKVAQVAGDMRFVLDATLQGSGPFALFADYIDPDRVGALGHTLGGTAALEVCLTDRRFDGCADLDGSAFGIVEQEGVAQPFLVLLNEPVPRVGEEMRLQRRQEWVEVSARQPTTAFLATVAGTMHLSFTDLPFLVPDSVMAKNGAVIDPELMHEITSRLLRAYFASRFGEGSDAAIEAAADDYDEVSLEVLRNPGT